MWRIYRMSSVFAGNWGFDMRRLLLLLPWIFFACAESDDGPIPIYPEGFPVGGYGYVLHAQLDSGHRFHRYGDTLELSLDSMWTFGNCFLRNIELYEAYAEDSVLTLTVKLALGNTGITDCPLPLFRPDTVLKIPFFERWKSVREIRVEGNAHNDFFKESPDTVSLAATLALKDSIWIRRGTFLAESVSVYLDSAFGDPYRMPRRTPNDSAGILARVDSVDVDTFAYRLMKSVCTEVHDSCETVPDTLWLSRWSSDTNLVAVRKTCKDDSLVFCLSSNWKNDSTALGDSVYRFLDTTWHSTFFYAEKIPKCSGMDHGDFSGRAVPGRYFVTNHTLFVPATDEASCGPAANSEWFFLNLNSGEEVLDSAFADTLLQSWKEASVGFDEDKNE